MGDEAREETSLMDDLAAAWPEDDDLTLSGAHEQENDDGGQANEPVVPDEAGDDEREQPGDGGRPDPISGKADGEAVQGDNKAEEKRELPEGDPAPVGLSVAAREAWKDTPQPMREAIAKREKDFAVGIQKYAEAANRSQQMDQALAPFQQYFATQGQPVAQSVNQLLQTASIMQMGTPNQKAQTIVDLMSQFGVDVPAVDALLTGGDVPQDVQNQNMIKQHIDEAIAPYQTELARLREAGQGQQNAMQAQVGDEVTAFGNDPKNEFYADVKMDMADILDMANNRGIEMSLQQAYDKACLLNNEIQKATQARNAQAALKGKKSAASAVSGSMGGPGDPSTPDSLRGTIEDAWDNAGRM